MDFTKINTEQDCDCVKGLGQDTESLYARAITDVLATDDDFKSHWEKGYRGKGCAAICKYKGVSLSIITSDDVKEKVVKMYKQVFSTAPNYKKAVLIFSLYHNAGVIKPTPTKNNEFHHDLYKEDNFTLNSLTNIESVPLTSEANV